MICERLISKWKTVLRPPRTGSYLERDGGSTRKKRSLDAYDKAYTLGGASRGGSL